MKIFVCHPLRSSGAIEGNIEAVKAIAREISLRGDTPYVPHFSALFLSCGIKEEDEAGIRDALIMLQACDKIEVHGLIGGAMHEEIKLAQELGFQVDFSNAIIGIPVKNGGFEVR